MQETDLEGLPIEDGAEYVYELSDLWAYEHISQMAFEETDTEVEKES